MQHRVLLIEEPQRFVMLTGAGQGLPKPLLLFAPVPER
jgi:hypothetical protein